MKLIKVHRPKSKDELYGLIKVHHETNCECGIKSQGTVEDIGRNLYEAQLQAWGQYKHTLQECIQWEYDLFVIQSLKGTLIENKALQEFSAALKDYSFAEAEGFVDEELRIDLIISKNGNEIAGIQVKPHTFNMMREGVISFNKAANAKWGKQVFYLFYNDQEQFTNFDDVVEQIKKLN
ncbi:MAG: MjaI family restriction endonuclease [Bacteroidia bacterium]